MAFINIRHSLDAELFMSRTKLTLRSAQIPKIPPFDSDAELNLLEAKHALYERLHLIFVVIIYALSSAHERFDV